MNATPSIGILHGTKRKVITTTMVKKEAINKMEDKTKTTNKCAISISNMTNRSLKEETITHL